MKTEFDNTENEALSQTSVRRCFANSLPFYEYPIPEENRIKKLFSEFEIREIGIKKVTDRIRKEMGAKFNCNRVEVDWITSELKKPTKDTLKAIEWFDDYRFPNKVRRLENNA